MGDLHGHLSLTLSSHTSQLLDGIWSLYKSEIGADLEFVCVGGRKVKVHRWLVQIFAPHILEHSHTNSIELSIEKDDLDLIFQFLYKGELDIDEGELVRLKRAAEILLLDHLLDNSTKVNKSSHEEDAGVSETESDSDADWTLDSDYKTVSSADQIINDNLTPVIVKVSPAVPPDIPDQQTELEIINNVGNDIFIISPKPIIQQRSILKRALLTPVSPERVAAHRNIQGAPHTAAKKPVISWKKNASGGVTVRCIKCEFLATEKGVYQHHVVSNHPELDLVERLRCRCPTCDFVVKQKDLMYYHWRDTHKPKKQKVFKCGECDFTAETKRLFDRHQRNKHSPDRPFSCDLCDYRGTSKLNLKVHLDIHNAKLYKCETCGKIGNSQTNMRKHRLIHLDQQFPCPVCAYPFRQKMTLKRHLLLKHNMRLPPDNMERDKRQKTHYKLVQKIQCPICDHTVSHKKDLLNHLAGCHQVDEHLNHVNPTISCPEINCDFMCYVETELVGHLQDVHGQSTQKAVCDICWNSYSTKYLKLHRETVHVSDTAKYMCHLCGFTTNSRAGLSQHMKRCSENKVESS